MLRPIITFTSDFGPSSPYVAEMKGVALTICPEANLVDISHAVPPQNVRCGACYLAQAAGSFPQGSIHVAVVDPGVGTDRRIIVAHGQSHLFVAPDNGLLSRVTPAGGWQRVVEATEVRYWRTEVSATFHGRDIMTPLAAHLANGIALESFGSDSGPLVEFSFPEPEISTGRIRGEVAAIDSFGNLLSNIHATHLAGRTITSIRCRGAVLPGLVRTYAEREPGDFVALVGSSGWIEIARVGGSAALGLQAELAEPIYLECQ